MRQETRGALSRPAPAVLFLLLLSLIAGAGLLAAVRGFRDRSRLATGSARWIWYLRDLTHPEPLKFYAERHFVLAAVPVTARAKVFVDRRGAVVVNGSRFEAGERRPGDDMRILDVGRALKSGRNRVVIEAESPTGAGGILFALDLRGENAIVSDGLWRVALAESVLARGGGARPVVLGRPPMYPWRYPASSLPGSPSAP